MFNSLYGTCQHRKLFKHSKRHAILNPFIFDGFLWWTFLSLKLLAGKVTLAKSGLKVTVLESRSILGGRARSWIDGVTRDPVHIGPHVVVSEYPNFFKLLDQLGTLQKILFWASFFVHDSISCYVGLFVSFCLFVCLVVSEWPATGLLRLPDKDCLATMAPLRNFGQRATGTSYSNFGFASACFMGTCIYLRSFCVMGR